MKVKDNDELINVIRLNEDQLISVLTHKGMSLTYSSEELSDTDYESWGEIYQQKMKILSL